jgi:hypothetical protein
MCWLRFFPSVVRHSGIY